MQCRTFNHSSFTIQSSQTTHKHVIAQFPPRADYALFKCYCRFAVSACDRFNHIASINAYRFPPPRIFTTALLGSHDITALIRDTEAHERALFQVDPSTKAHGPQRRATRRGTMFPAETERESMASRIYSARDNRNQSAVARVLGHDMMEEIKRSAGTSTRGPRGEVNVEVLLRGAEILCNV